MARFNTSWQSRRPQQCIFCLVLVISVLLLTMETFVCSVPTDLHHSDAETNLFDGSPKMTTNLEIIYISSLASLLEGINNLAIVPDKDTALNNRKRRSNSDSEAFPFEAPESCTLSETELDQILGLFQKFTKVDKNFCNVQTVERPKQIGPVTSVAAASKSTDSKETPVTSSKTVASRPTSTNSTKTVSKPTSNSKLISSASKSTANSTKLAASPTTGVQSTGVVSPTKSVTNSTKPKISSVKSAANVVQLAVSPTKSARNSTKPIVNPKNSTETAASPIDDSTASFLIRRKRSLPTKTGGGCNKLIESIQLSTSSVRSAYCDLSTTEELDPRFNEKKAAYETEVAQLREKLDNKDLQIEQKYKTKIEQLNKDFQKLERNMRDTLEKLESVEHSHRRIQAKLIISYLKSGVIKEALEEFKKIESRNNTVILITIALQDEFGIPIENVINFVRGMEELESMVHGTIHIFYELEKKQCLIEKKVVSLLKETVNVIMEQLVELEKKGKLGNSYNIDRATVGQLVLLVNKLDYLLVSPFKYN